MQLLQARSSIMRSPPCFSEVTLKLSRLPQLKTCFNSKLCLGMRNIWVCHPWWGRKKKSFFNDIKLKVLSKISSWQSKLFSSGGREVLIKAVAQAVPAYAMSVFKVPMSLCADIQKAIARFWWGSKGN